MSATIEHMSTYDSIGVQLTIVTVSDRHGQNPVKLWIDSYDHGHVSVATEEGGDVVWLNKSLRYLSEMQDVLAPYLATRGRYGQQVNVDLSKEQAEQLQDLLDTHPTLHEDFPALETLDIGPNA